MEIDDANLYWIHDIKQIDTNKVQILNEPFASNSAIWELDMLITKFTKIKDFDSYKNKEYTELIEW